MGNINLILKEETMKLNPEPRSEVAGLSERNNVCGLKKMTHGALMTVFV